MLKLNEIIIYINTYIDKNFYINYKKEKELDIYYQKKKDNYEV
jgi:hypothetical protein